MPKSRRRKTKKNKHIQVVPVMVTVPVGTHMVEKDGKKVPEPLFAKVQTNRTKEIIHRPQSK